MTKELCHDTSVFHNKIYCLSNFRLPSLLPLSSQPLSLPLSLHSLYSSLFLPKISPHFHNFVFLNFFSPTTIRRNETIDAKVITQPVCLPMRMEL